MDKIYVCPVCSHKTVYINNGFYQCNNCLSRYPVDTVRKYIENGEYNTHHDHRILKDEIYVMGADDPLFPPEPKVDRRMRTAYFKATGNYGSDKEVLLFWRNKWKS